MNKIHIIFTFIATSLILSCQKSEVEDSAFENSQIETVLNLEGQTQRNAYTLLDKELKHRIWNEKLNRIKPDLNSEQQRVTNELLSLIDPSFFSVSKSSKDASNTKIDDWFIDAQKHFSKAEFIDVFVTLNNRGPGTLPIGSDGCSCNGDEDYCRWQTSCSGSGCEGSGWGCGLLWNSPCNGTCA